jgi:peptidoglycan/xylan/chitin deacetylase (PgdA/CDA1 family)
MPLIAYEHADRNVNKIALTFDDGPNPFWTRKILDILDKYNVKANFFVLGKRVEKYSEIAKEIFERGHLIGNHSYSHSREFGDFEEAEKIIFNTIGMHTKFIRPPYLLVDLCNNYPPAINGEVKIINCDVFPEDWRKKAEDIKKIILPETKNGSIIGLHDSSYKDGELKDRAKEMIKVLPEIIETLKEKFEIVRLDNMTLSQLK